MVDWGPISELATSVRHPIPMGIAELWAGRIVSEVVALLKPRLPSGPAIGIPSRDQPTEQTLVIIGKRPQ